MIGRSGISFRIALPLPVFLMHPVTAAVIAAVHVYLAGGHLAHLYGGDIEWTHLWKGFGALGGAYVFAALASRGLVQRRIGSRHPLPDVVGGSSQTMHA